jgi:antitoxin component of MazEF toxin-antitoxin module
MVSASETILTKAHSKTDSLRVTVPNCICKQLGLNEGDKISWKISDKKDQLILDINHKKERS